MVDLGVRRPELQRRPACLGLAVAIAPQVRQHRLVGPGARFHRVDVEHLPERLPRLRVSFGIDQVVDLEQETIDVAGVDLERIGQRLGGSGPAVVREGAGEEVVIPG